MFEKFRDKFTRDEFPSTSGNEPTSHCAVSSQNNMVDCLGGSSFNQGLYRVIRASDEKIWNARVVLAYPEFTSKISCFGFDWLGRIFAVDPRRTEGGQSGVVMFEPGTGEVLEIPCNILSFHNEELIHHKDAALASQFHEQWVSNGGRVPNYGQCVGYQKPMFFGGVDEVSNLVLLDMEVYWHIMGQLIAKIRGLQPGTEIAIRKK